MKFITSALVAGAMIAGVNAAQASTLYDNGPINGSLDSFTINLGFAVSDSFTLGSSSTLTGVDFGSWNYSGDSIVSVNWGIATTPNDYTDFVASGTGLVSLSDTFSNNYGYDVSTASFALPGVNLDAGTYYLVLQNAVTSFGDPTFWDENNGQSSASDNSLGDLADFDLPGTTGSESFQILGTPTTPGVPEPATWAMMIGGFGLVGASLRASRRTVAFAA